MVKELCELMSFYLKIEGDKECHLKEDGDIFLDRDRIQVDPGTTQAAYDSQLLLLFPRCTEKRKRNLCSTCSSSHAEDNSYGTMHIIVHTCSVIQGS